jgi:hypothetical protein
MFDDGEGAVGDWLTPCASLTMRRELATIRWSVQSCSRAGSRHWTSNLLKATAAASSERDVLVRLHSLQGLVERDLILDWHGVTPLELLDQVGLLNERLLIPHATYTDRNPAVHGEDRGDLARLADSRVPASSTAP